MNGYFNDNLLSSFRNMAKSLAEPNRTKSYKLERVLNKNLESFQSAMFPNLWNAFEIDLKENKSAKIFKQRVINIYLLRIMRGLNAKNLAVYRVNKFYIKKLK